MPDAARRKQIHLTSVWWYRTKENKIETCQTYWYDIVEEVEVAIKVIPSRSYIDLKC